MALPSGVAKVTVTAGTYRDQGGGGTFSGTITFTPAAPRRHLASGDYYSADPIVMTLTGGVGIQELIASDATGFDRTNVQYSVAYHLIGPSGPVEPLLAKRIFLYASTPTVDLESLSTAAPISPSTPLTSGVISVAGLGGVVEADDLAPLLAPYLSIGGSDVLTFRNLSAEPTAGPADGGSLYAFHNALKWRSANGNTSTIAPA